MSASQDPFARFREAYAAAESVDRALLPDPSAMSLATVGPDGQPSLRMVLLKGLHERGFVFYTNLGSRKARELLASPQCALCFHWPPLEVQVRVEGRATLVADDEADAYFATRARTSQLGAWASRQSEPIPPGVDLLTRLQKVEARFAGREVPRPPYWTGFCVVAERIEFWRGRPYRLHDRELYIRERDGWRVERLYP